MKSPTSGFKTAMDKTGSSPVWLLELNGNYYSDRSVSDGTNSYTAKVLEWSDVSEITERTSGGGVLSTANLLLHSDVYADVRIGNTAKIYLWFEGESLTASDRLLMFSGIVSDPITVTETDIACSLKPIEEIRNAVVGELVELNTFPNSDLNFVGKMLPIIYGDVQKHECLPLDAGVLTSLFADLTGSATSLEVSDSTGLENGDVVLIDDEQILLSGKSGNTFVSCTRAHNSTVAVAHDRGADVVEKLSAYDFLIADHAITSLDAVYAKGVRIDGADYSLQTVGGRSYVRFSSHPKIVNSVDIDVDVTDDSDYTPEVYTVESYTPESYTAESVADNITDPTTAQKGDDVTIVGDMSYSMTDTQTRIEKINFGAPVDGNNNAVYTANLYLSGDVGSIKVATSTNTAAHDGYKTVMGTVYNVEGSTPINISTSTARQWLWVYIDAIDGQDGLYYELQSPTRSEEVAISISKNGQVDHTVSSLANSSLTNSSLINSSYVAGSMPTTVTGNTSAGTAYTRDITVDCTGYSSKSPDLVVKHLLETYGNGVVSGDLGTSLTSDSEGFENDYDLGFAILQQSDLMALCRKVAYQSFSRFHWDSGLAKLSRYEPNSDLMTNGGFEGSWSGGVPAGWTVESDEVYLITGYNGTGSACAIDGDGTTEGWFYQDVPVEDGAFYRLSFVAKNLLYAAQVHVTKPTGEDIYAKTFVELGGYSAWGETQFLTFAAIGTTARIKFGSQTSASSDIAIDNVTLVKIDSPIGKNDVVINTMKMRWSPFRQIINSIDAPYALIEGEFSAIESASDATSISSYGKKDGSNKFQLDFVQNSTTSNNVVSGYLSRLKEPKRIAEFVCPLTKVNIERGDIIAVTHDLDGGWVARLFIVNETHFIIGSGIQHIADAIRIVAEEL